MINKGDKVEAIQSYGIQKGDVFFVKQVEAGSVSLEDGSGTAHLTVPINVYDKYFAKHKKSWSDWKLIDSRLIDECGMCPMESYCYYNGREDLNCRDMLSIEFRTNEKKVQVRTGGYQASASCDKLDIFDLKKGLLIATRRLCEKMLIAHTKKKSSEYIKRVIFD